jgi:UDP-N-acetylmuramate dehydrogenase
VYPSGAEATRKLSAAWLIEKAGWKGFRDGDAGVSEKHALVLVNRGNATGMQLLDLARRITASVQERFGVALEPEARIVGADF